MSSFLYVTLILVGLNFVNESLNWILRWVVLLDFPQQSAVELKQISTRGVPLEGVTYTLTHA